MLFRSKFRISEALMISYKLFWDEFSGWYLEIIKPEYQKPIDRKSYNEAVEIFENLMKVIHPFMPFITEELWQMLKERKNGESIMISMMPEAKRYNKELISDFEYIKETVTAIRSVRKAKDIPNRESLELMILAQKESYDSDLFPIIRKLCNLTEISFVPEKQKGAASFMIGITEFFIPLQGKLDTEAEIAKLMEDLDYNRGFLLNVMKKLDNERFVNNAPADVLDLEKIGRASCRERV